MSRSHFIMKLVGAVFFTKTESLGFTNGRKKLKIMLKITFKNKKIFLKDNINHNKKVTL